MKLKSLKLKNFLAYADANINFADVTLIAGGNNQGKSTVRDAIEFVLCGTCRGLKQKNKAMALARTGSTEFECVLDTHQGVFTRTQSNRGVELLPPDVVRVLVNQPPSAGKVDWVKKYTVGNGQISEIH